MRGNIRRGLMGIAWLTFPFVGCKSAPASNPSSTQGVPVVFHGAETSVSTESSEQQDAQRAWCEYLDALHRRGGTSGAMPGLEKCLQARTYAAPKMLRQTAQCARAALEQFEGDPFTKEYAAAVARCGSDALEACEAGNAEIEPFMATICASVARCTDMNAMECPRILESRLRIHLSRAVGAMNGQGRGVFQTCLEKITCGDVSSQIVSCLEPIMDGLLWLPE